MPEDRDLVRVIRCRDCANGNPDEPGPEGYVYCDLFGYGGFLPEDWYCANGKPRSAEGEEKE